MAMDKGSDSIRKMVHSQLTFSLFENLLAGFFVLFFSHIYNYKTLLFKAGSKEKVNFQEVPIFSDLLCKACPNIAVSELAFFFFFSIRYGTPLCVYYDLHF